MKLHYFELSRSGRRVLFREDEYTSIIKPDFGQGLVLSTRTGAEFRVTTSKPTQIAEEVDLAR
jgi:hypothetical protein